MPALDTRMVAALRERAVALHLSGRLDEAEDLYRRAGDWQRLLSDVRSQLQAVLPDLAQAK